MLNGFGDVRRLLAFIATGQQQNAVSPNHRVINAISRPPIDPQFPNPAAHRLTVAEVSSRQPIDPGINPGFRNIIGQRFQP